MTINIPDTMAAALLISGFAQRAISADFGKADLPQEARFSIASSYCCFALAAIALAAGFFVR